MMEDDKTTVKQKSKVAFRPEITAGPMAAVDLAKLAPPEQEEPKIESGIDLAGKPKIIMAVGRGKTGKTTLLRWVTEMALQRGTDLLLADIDPSNASFSQYFNDVHRPKIDEAAGVTAWLGKLLDYCVAQKQSAVIDLGGGDTTLRSLATEMPGLAESIEAAGLAPVMFYMAGTQPEDLTPALTLEKRGFSVKAQAVVFNEFAAPPGVNREEAFARVGMSAGCQKLRDKSITLWMPKLFSAEVIEARQCGFLAARDQRLDPPLGLLDSTRTRAWLDHMNRRFAGVASWIP
jgi:hypothetical protein